MTVIQLKYWALAALLIFISGCASPEYTKRQCVIQLVGQIAPGQLLTVQFCEREEPYTPEKAE